jgi:hypothetical protein
MSKIFVNLEESQVETKNSPSFGEYQQPPKRSILKKIFLFSVGFLLLSVIIGAIVSYFYWQSVKQSPQYSLALMVDAARRDDKQALDQLVDTEAVATDFVPQITEKAIELYGKGLPKEIIGKVAQIASPLIPVIKNKARDELPKLIREKTQKFENVPYWMIALGANQAVDVKIEGEFATITSKIPEKPLEFKMKKNGNLWQVVSIKDEKLATTIAQRFGQQIVALASKGGLQKVGEQFGIQGLDGIVDKLQDLMK